MGFLSRPRGGIAARIYFFALLALLAVASLATASIYFSQITEHSAKVLYGDGFVGVTNSTRLELLLEHHRRIVESMPAEVDRHRIEVERAELEQIQSKLTELMGEIGGDEGLMPDTLEWRIAKQLPPLFAEAERVVFYANEFAQDKATETVARYVALAADLQGLVVSFRGLRLREARQAIGLVSEAAKSLMVWVLACVGIACVLIGPIGLSTMHHVLYRLRGITEAMVKLAANDTSTQVPSRDDADEVGEMARAVEVFKNNAIQLIAREIELKQLNHRIDVALNNMTHGLCMFDADQKLIVCNRTYVEMYELPSALARPGTTLGAIDAYRSSIGNSAISSPEQVAASTTAHQTLQPSAFAQELIDGRTIAVSRRPMLDGGWVAVHEDITERRRSEAKIAHLARHDILTNLPNRVLFREHLEIAFRSAQAERGCAVHCLDLDHFKNVNDTLGHPVGDDLLKAAADRLTEVLPDSAFVARIGGDEFAVIQTDVERPEKSSSLASRIIEAVSKPYDIDGKHIVIGTSIGIAIAPNDGSNPDQLLRNADMALYLAKADGRGVHRFFEREMDKRLQARRSLELDLRKAVDNGEFELHFQPIVDFKTEEVSSFEALVRWRHPVRGLVSPVEFISLAEETGLMLPLGEWILRTACNEAARWPSACKVAVNLSATQFKSKNLVQLTVNALAASGLPPNRLDLEITETVLLQDESYTLSVLHQLRGVGIQISLDDFGTGYSSLAYLRNFPFDTIKIDRSFVQDMLVRKDCQAIVRAVVGLARSLDITTIIEGVETVEQMDAAKADGCNQGQGYLFSKPMPAAAVADFLAKRGKVASAA
jgi:diguanylate cyclase (GGDEF)-like protein